MNQLTILLSPKDNCVVAISNLAAGTCLQVGGERITLGSAISLGHKLACKPLRAGDKVVKYGAVIGHVVADVAVGAHLHTHNVESDYIATHTRDAARPVVPHSWWHYLRIGQCPN